MSDFLLESELTESRAFIRSFVKEIRVSPGKAVIHYTMPTPPDSSIRGGTAAEVALESPVLPTVTRGRPTGTRTVRPPPSHPFRDCLRVSSSQ